MKHVKVEQCRHRQVMVSSVVLVVEASPATSEVKELGMMYVMVSCEVSLK